MRNKKGQLITGTITAGVLLAIALIVFIIVGGGAVFIWLITANIYKIIGGAVLILSLIVGLPLVLKNPNQKTIGVLSVFLIIGAIFFILPFLSSAFNFSISGFSNSKVYVSESGTLMCKEDPVEEITIKWADQGYTFTCGSDYLVDDCRVYGDCSSNAPRYSPQCSGKYEKNGKKVSYALQRGEVKLITTIEVGDSILFEEDVTGINEKYLELNYERNPYRLWSEEFGKDFLVSSSDCCLANQDELQRKNFEYGDWDCIEKGSVRNYFLGWTEVYGAKVYGNKICLSNALYELDEVELADGSSVNVQGNFIKYVECCPHMDNNCDSSTFTFLQSGEEEERECTYDYQCANTGDPEVKTDTKAIQETCVDGTCFEKEITIECGSDAKCMELYGDGWGCDLSLDNFGKCIKIGSIEQPRCGDGICQVGETSEDCPADCGSSDDEELCIEKGGEWIEGDVIKKGRGFLGIGKLIGLYDEVQEPGKCLFPHNSIFAVILILLGIAIIVFGIIKEVPIAMIPGAVFSIAGLIWFILARMGYA